MRLVSWNVLADAYIRPQWFPGTSAGLLAPGARTAAILHRIRGFDADVIALQEADPALAAAGRRLPGYRTFWAPKGRGRPDGCLTLVRDTVHVIDTRRLFYHDGPEPSGHVAHLLRLTGPDTVTVTVVNTHLTWEQPGTASQDHTGLRQAAELVRVLHGRAAIICADLNDLPGGPVRQMLTGAGFAGAGDIRPTSLFNGPERRALDVVAVRRPGTFTTTVTGVTVPLPGPSCPSDHVPVTCDLHQPR
jgi:endonuclease/exonuclease/phosphatase family metal-dependent hydrolase